MARAHIELNTSQLIRNLAEYDRDVDRNIDLMLEYYATVGEAAMKSNAPWTDRTGAARTGLHTTTSKRGRGADGRFTSGGNERSITFSHTVPYGIWLEIKFSGRDAVIMPTILQVGPMLMAALSRVIR